MATAGRASLIDEADKLVHRLRDIQDRCLQDGRIGKMLRPGIDPRYYRKLCLLIGRAERRRDLRAKSPSGTRDTVWKTVDLEPDFLYEVRRHISGDLLDRAAAFIPTKEWSDDRNTWRWSTPAPLAIVAEVFEEKLHNESWQDWNIQEVPRPGGAIRYIVEDVGKYELIPTGFDSTEIRFDFERIDHSKRLMFVASILEARDRLNVENVARLEREQDGRKHFARRAAITIHEAGRTRDTRATSRPTSYGDTDERMQNLRDIREGSKKNGRIISRTDACNRARISRATAKKQDPELWKKENWNNFDY